MTSLGLPDADLELEESFGVAAQVGFDIPFGNNWFINADLRYIEIQPKANVKSGGTSVRLGTIKIDPMVYSIMLGTRF